MLALERPVLRLTHLVAADLLAFDIAHGVAANLLALDVAHALAAIGLDGLCAVAAAMMLEGEALHALRLPLHLEALAAKPPWRSTRWTWKALPPPPPPPRLRIWNAWPPPPPPRCTFA